MGRVPSRRAAEIAGLIEAPPILFEGWLLRPRAPRGGIFAVRKLVTEWNETWHMCV